MTVSSESLHRLAELEGARRQLKRAITKSKGYGFYLREADNDDAPHVSLPPAVGMDILCAAIGIVTARIIESGVHVSAFQGDET